MTNAPATVPRSPTVILTAVLALGLGLLLVWRLILLLRRVIVTLPHPFQFDPTEGILLSEFVLLTQRVNIYAPFTPERFISAPYPPVYYLLVTPWLRLTGINFWAGRTINLLAALLIALLIASIIGRRGVRLPALVAGALWLGSPPLLVWATRLKPDLVAIAFALAGVWLAEGWQARDGHEGQESSLRDRRLWLVVLCITLGFYSKQSAIAGGLAIGLWLLGHNLRHALIYGAAQAVALLAPWVILDLVTKRGFWIHMVDYHALPWSAQRWLGIVGDMTTYHWCLSVLTIGYLVVRRHRWELPAIYIAVVFVASFSGGTFGGFHNHALELLAALCLGAGLAASIVLQLRRTALLLALVAVLVAQLGSFWLTPRWLEFEIGNVPQEGTTRRLRGVQNLVRGQRGPVWGDNVGLIVMAGKPVRFNDPLIMAKAAELGWWNERVFTRLLRTGHFDLVLWRSDLFAGKRPNDLSPRQYEALREGYQILYRDIPLVYAPVR